MGDIRVLEAPAKDEATLELAFTRCPRGCECFLEYGHMMPEDGPEKPEDVDAICPGGTAITHVLTDAVAQMPSDSA